MVLLVWAATTKTRTKQHASGQQKAQIKTKIRIKNKMRMKITENTKDRSKVVTPTNVLADSLNGLFYFNMILGAPGCYDEGCCLLCLDPW